jgi:hypothetical protein
MRAIRSCCASTVSSSTHAPAYRVGPLDRPARRARSGPPPHAVRRVHPGTCDAGVPMRDQLAARRTDLRTTRLTRTARELPPLRPRRPARLHPRRPCSRLSEYDSRERTTHCPLSPVCGGPNVIRDLGSDGARSNRAVRQVDVREGAALGLARLHVVIPSPRRAT